MISETLREAASEKIIASSIFQQGQELHKLYDDKVWDKEGLGKPAFHNAAHIKAVWKAAKLLLDYRGDDAPFDFHGELATYNRMRWPNGDAGITLKDLPYVMQIAIGVHDLGNAYEAIDFYNGSLNRFFLKTYMASGAEERSKRIASSMILSSNLQPDKKRIFVVGAKDFIGQTTVDFDSVGDPEGEFPFAQFMRFCDQVGNYYFNQNEKMLEGLLLEMIEEDYDCRVIPDGFVNFIANRAPKLVRDHKRRSMIYKIWGVEEVKLIKGLPTDPMLARDFLPIYLEAVA